MEYMLSAGRGRPIIEMLRSGIAGRRDIVLDQCLHNRAYDRQCEGSRADYLYPLFRGSEAEPLFRTCILQALLDTTDFLDAEQLFDFAVIFARDGDSEARRTIYDKFRRHDGVDGPLDGARHIIELDGVDGLLAVAAEIGANERLIEHNDGSDYLVRVAEDAAGRAVVREALEKAQIGNRYVDSFLQSIADEYVPDLRLEDVSKRKRHTVAAEDRRARTRGMSWSQFRSTPRNAVLSTCWAKGAPDVEIERAAHGIIAEEDPGRLAWYLRIFWNRRFPLHPSHLVRLFDTHGFKVSNAVINALVQISHPEVRALFERLVGSRDWAPYAVDLLQSNYRDGDDQLIERLLLAENDPEHLHTLCGNVHDVCKANPVPEAARLLLLTYEKSPCSICRSKDVELLRERGELPAWMIEECAHDASERSRRIASGHTDTTSQ